jgi:hypothetical protein
MSLTTLHWGGVSSAEVLASSTVCIRFLNGQGLTADAPLQHQRLPRRREKQLEAYEGKSARRDAPYC